MAWRVLAETNFSAQRDNHFFRLFSNLANCVFVRFQRWFVAFPMGAEKNYFVIVLGLTWCLPFTFIFHFADTPREKKVPIGVLIILFIKSTATSHTYNIKNIIKIIS